MPRHPPYALDNCAEISIDDRYSRRVDILRRQHDSMIHRTCSALHRLEEQIFCITRSMTFDLTLLLTHVCGRSAESRPHALPCDFTITSVVKKHQKFDFRLPNGNLRTIHSTIVIPSFEISQWILAGSNRRPPACKAGALPAELRTLEPSSNFRLSNIA